MCFLEVEGNVTMYCGNHADLDTHQQNHNPFGKGVFLGKVSAFSLYLN